MPTSKLDHTLPNGTSAIDTPKTRMASREHPPENVSLTEGPELGQTSRTQVLGKHLNTDYPVSLSQHDRD